MRGTISSNGLSTILMPLIFGGLQGRTGELVSVQAQGEMMHTRVGAHRRRFLNEVC